jgi:hypothetical protein
LVFFYFQKKVLCTRRHTPCPRAMLAPLASTL